MRAPSTGPVPRVLTNRIPPGSESVSAGASPASAVTEGPICKVNDPAADGEEGHNVGRIEFRADGKGFNIVCEET